MRFAKWQALGNDYLIVEQAELPWPLTPARIQRMCDPHVGVGSDGILLLSEPALEGFVADLRIFNPDGSEAELSGNGAREATMYLRRRGWTEADEFAISTAAGPMRPLITGPSTCRMDMGRASLSSPGYPAGDADGRGELEAGGRRWSFQHVSVGNPQCAIRVDDIAALEALELPAIGPAIEHHELFPNRTNVSWFAPLEATRAGSSIRARIFERGVGETLSSGTGAAGAAVAHVQAGGLAPVTVRLDGGELEVEIDGRLNMTLSGWAVPVYAGELSTELIEELDATE